MLVDDGCQGSSPDYAMSDVVDKVALGQVFFGYFGFLCQSFYRLLYIHHYLSSGSGTIGLIVADIATGLSLTPIE
jgi:hypothetical protein